MAHVPNTIHQLCRGIARSVGNSSLIGIEFEDLRSAIAGNGGRCAFGYGVANNGINAAGLAIKHPFLKHSNLQYASAAIVAIEGPPDTMTMHDMKRVLDMVRSHFPVGVPVMYSSVVSPAGQRPTCTVSILAAGVQDPKNL
jgi:cell division GTPase FtsZ